MEIVKASIRRITMTIMFCLALLTTFETISGVKAMQVANWWSFDRPIFWDKVEDDNHANDANEKQLALQARSLPFLASDEKVMSHEVVEAPPPTLEEAIDWSQYKTQTVVATGYTAGVESTGKSPGHPGYGITFSGVKVKRDLYSTIAADPSVFPIGSILFIPGYGYGVVADTGSAIKGNIIDLYYETVEEVYQQWGKQEIDVYIVKEGDGKLTEDDLEMLNEAEAVQVFRRQLF